MEESPVWEPTIPGLTGEITQRGDITLPTSARRKQPRAEADLDCPKLDPWGLDLLAGWLAMLGGSKKTSHVSEVVTLFRLLLLVTPT